MVFTALTLMFGVEQAGRKVSRWTHSYAIHYTSELYIIWRNPANLRWMQWSLVIGATGQAFAMFYIGINQRVHPDDASLSGNNLFAIICIYLFVVFYSFGWGPIPYVVSSEVSPNHGTPSTLSFRRIYNSASPSTHFIIERDGRALSMLMYTST